MYREKDLQACLTGLIGFRQNVNPDYPNLSPGLLASSSGLYVQDEHPLLCIENLDQALKNYDHFNFPVYAIGTTYNTGDQVRYSNNLVYESLDDDNIGNAPTASGSTHWVEINLFSQRLDSFLKGSAAKVLADIFVEKKIAGATKSVFESVQVFDGSGAIIDKEIKSGRFVGYALRMFTARDLTAVIRRLGTQFSQANPDFKLYVFHSSQSVPLKVFNLALSKSNAFEWTRLLDSGQDYLLRYLSDDHGPGGMFFIGYYEDDLVGQAINREYSFSIPPTCGSCSASFYYYEQWSKYFEILPFSVKASNLVGLLPTDIGGPFLWDMNQMEISYSRNFGLNLDISMRCDVTDFLCREANIFSNILIKQVTVDLLNAIAFSTRNNAIAKETRDMAMYALNNKDNNTPGVLKQLEKAKAAINIDTSDLNSDCLPCANNKGPSWGSI